MYTGTHNKHKGQTPARTEWTESTPALWTYTNMKQLKLSKDFRLNKIINKEELTQQLTFHRGVQMLPRILLLIIYKIIAQAMPSFTHTRKSSESPMWLKRVAVGEQTDPESLTCYNLHVSVMSAFSYRTCARA